MKITPGLFTSDECKKIIALCDFEAAETVKDDSYVYGIAVEQLDPVDGDWILERLKLKRVLKSGRIEFGGGMSPLVLKYKPGQGSRKHSDRRTGFKGRTMIVFLNDDYEGGEFYIFPSAEKTLIDSTPGTAVTFQGEKHMVTKVTKGIRYALVSWRRK